MTKKSENPQQDYSEKLLEIRTSLATIDAARCNKTLSEQERKILELSAAALREAEMIEIHKAESHLLKQLEESVNSLKQKSRDIRARVTRMNKTPQAIDAIERALKIITEILKAALLHI
ncbi:MAG TPA: hypothetical protein VFC94_03580 [Bacteroidaceae bacterium]|nr:hypothetical protein [Bacteroidaceae bacterium]